MDICRISLSHTISIIIIIPKVNKMFQKSLEHYYICKDQYNLFSEYGIIIQTQRVLFLDIRIWSTHNVCEYIHDAVGSKAMHTSKADSV